MFSPTILASGVAVFLLYLVHLKRRQAKLPPGPPRLPLIGNLHQAPADAPWITFDKWIQQYGPLVSLDFGGPVILVGNYDTARDLLDKRATIYSSRPRMVSGYPFANRSSNNGMMFLGNGRRANLQGDAHNAEAVWRRVSFASKT